MEFTTCMKIGITGASGHLGTALIYRLLENEGHQIFAHHFTGKRSILHPAVDWIQSDLSKSSMDLLVQKCEVIIHCAAIISINGHQNNAVFDTNINGTRNVVDACVLHKVKRLIHVSSTHALQEVPLDSVFDESRPYKTENDFAYDFSKASAEKVVLNAIQNRGLNAIIVRPSSMVGPPDLRPSLLGKAILDFSKGKIPAMVNGGYDFVDIRDVVNSIVNSIENGISGESYNLTGAYYSMRDLASLAAKAGGVKPPKFLIPNWMMRIMLPCFKLEAYFTKKQPRFTNESIHVLKFGHPNMSNEKAKRVLNHSSRGLEESILDLINSKLNDRKHL